MLYDLDSVRNASSTALAVYLRSFETWPPTSSAAEAKGGFEVADVLFRTKGRWPSSDSPLKADFSTFLVMPIQNTIPKSTTDCDMGNLFKCSLLVSPVDFLGRPLFIATRWKFHKSTLARGRCHQSLNHHSITHYDHYVTISKPLRNCV